MAIRKIERQSRIKSPVVYREKCHNKRIPERLGWDERRKSWNVKGYHILHANGEIEFINRSGVFTIYRGEDMRVVEFIKNAKEYLNRKGIKCKIKIA